MDTRDWYYQQPVLEWEMDDAFADVETADLRSESDKGQYGILSGFVADEDGGGPSMNIQISAGVGIDKEGHRLFSSGTVLQDITLDTLGNPTAPSAGNRRWVSIYARFGRDLSDPRTDGLSVPLFFKHAEALNAGDGTGTSSPTGDVQATVGQFLVVAGAQALIIDPIPTRPSNTAYSAILICDVLYTDGDTSFAIAQISTGRAQRYAQHFSAALPAPSEYDGALGVNYSLIMDVTGYPAGVKNRMYMSSLGLVLTENAAWDPELRIWVSDTVDPMSRIHFSGSGIKIFRIAVGTSILETDPWDAELDLNAFGTGGQITRLDADGTFTQQGTTHAFWGMNFKTSDGGFGRGGAFAYNIPFQAPPSSVTMSVVGSDLNIFADVLTGLNEYGGKVNITLVADNTNTNIYRLIEATF